MEEGHYLFGIFDEMVGFIAIFKVIRGGLVLSYDKGKSDAGTECFYMVIIIGEGEGGVPSSFLVPPPAFVNDETSLVEEVYIIDACMKFECLFSYFCNDMCPAKLFE